MNKSLYENIQNIDGNKTVNFGVCKSYWSENKTNFVKTSLNICILIESHK